MPKKDNSNKKIVSKTFIGIGILSAGCGAFHGFYDGFGIPMPSRFLDDYLVYGPSVIQGIFGIYDGASIARTGKQFTGNYPVCMEGELEKALKVPENPISPRLYGAMMGGIGEASGAAVETLMGYLVGLAAGRITRLFS